MRMRTSTASKLKMKLEQNKASSACLAAKCAAEMDCGVSSLMALKAGLQARPDNDNFDKQQPQAQEAKACSAIVPVLLEVVMTEKDFVRGLLAAVETYMLPLLAGKGKVSGEDIRSLFGNVMDLLALHTTVLANFESSINTALEQSKQQAEELTVRCIAGIVANEMGAIMPFLKQHASYCNGFRAASDHLESCRKQNKKLDSYLRKVEARPGNHNSSLQSLLVRPVQRLCKYPLLLRELAKSTDKCPNSEKLVGDVRRAQVAAEEVASSVNSKVADLENMDRVLSISKALSCPDLLTASRRHVKSEHVLGDDGEAYDLHRFNDVVVMALKPPAKKRSSFKLRKSRKSNPEVAHWIPITPDCKLPQRTCADTLQEAVSVPVPVPASELQRKVVPERLEEVLQEERKLHNVEEGADEGADEEEKERVEEHESVQLVQLEEPGVTPGHAQLPQADGEPQETQEREEDSESEEELPITNEELSYHLFRIKEPCRGEAVLAKVELSAQCKLAPPNPMSSSPEAPPQRPYRRYRETPGNAGADALRVLLSLMVLVLMTAALLALRTPIWPPLNKYDKFENSFDADFANGMHDFRALDARPDYRSASGCYSSPHITYY